MERFDRGQLETAIAQLRAIVNKHPQSSVAPQAVYYEGVGGYKISHDAKKLKKIYVELKEKYPGSLWAKKSIPYADIRD